MSCHPEQRLARFANLFDADRLNALRRAQGFAAPAHALPARKSVLHDPVLRLPWRPHFGIARAKDHHALLPDRRGDVRGPRVIAQKKTGSCQQRDQASQIERIHDRFSREMLSHGGFDRLVARPQIHCRRDAMHFSQPFRDRCKVFHGPALIRLGRSRTQHRVPLPGLDSQLGQPLSHKLRRIRAERKASPREAAFPASRSTATAAGGAPPCASPCARQPGNQSAPARYRTRRIAAAPSRRARARRKDASEMRWSGRRAC